jgi:hypothetical protein
MFDNRIRPFTRQLNDPGERERRGQSLLTEGPGGVPQSNRGAASRPASGGICDVADV